MSTTERASSRSRRRPVLRRRWRDLSVRRKYLCVTLLAVLFCAPPAVMALVFQARAADLRTDAEATEWLSDQVDDLQDTLVVADGAMKANAFAGGDPEPVSDYRAASARVHQLLDTIVNATPARLRDDVDALRSTSESLVDQSDTVMSFTAGQDEALPDEINQEGPAPDIVPVLTSLNNTMLDAQSRAEVVEQALDARLASQRDDLEQLEDRLPRSVLVALAVALAAVIGGTLLVTSGVLRRLERLSENGQRFLRGEPLVPSGRSADEIGRLTDGMEIVGELLDQRREQAVAATRAKDEFLSRLSHELRTPLTAVVGFGQMLADNPVLADDDRDAASNIVAGGEHMLTLINELLDVATIEAGRLDLAVEAFPVRDVTDETVALMRPLAATRQITIDTDGLDGDAAGPVVEADRRRVKQVLLNLLSNAVKYNRHDGRIDVTATRRDGAVRIAVSDTGPGISPDGLAKLFTPFERLGASGDIQGTGIGLALTKRLVEAMDGTIGAESEEGRGTTFWFDLPAAAVAAPGGAQRATTA